MIFIFLPRAKAAGGSGFTILEVIVVIFVIALGLLGVLSLVNQNTQVEYVNKNMLVASQLVQEGLELVRHKRDNNWLGGDNWLTGSTTNITTNIIQDGTYAVDYLGSTTAKVNSLNDSAAKLYIDTNGFYRHFSNPGSATTTPFSRMIRIDTQSTASATISCLVQWKRGTNSYQYAAQTVLYDWK